MTHSMTLVVVVTLVAGLTVAGTTSATPDETLAYATLEIPHGGPESPAYVEADVYLHASNLLNGGKFAAYDVGVYRETNGIDGFQDRWTCADGSSARHDREEQTWECADGSAASPPDLVYCKAGCMRFQGTHLT